MKIKQILIPALVMLFANTLTAQVITGNYTASGYFFHPTSPRYFSQSAPLTLISGSTYEVPMADLVGYSFRFTVDGTNHLINWTPGGSTPAIPSSGFMTLDNPGNITYTVTPGPGTAPYTQSNYNNTYDPATHTFYLHYGYAIGSSDQSGFTRQVYEKLVYAPTPTITSVTPLSGNILTPLTVRGHNFTGVEPVESITIGGTATDSAAVISDSVITVWPGLGSSGDITVANGFISATFPGFIYSPISVSPDPQWQLLGPAGFSTDAAETITITTDRNSIPYISFYDTLTKKAMVMKYVSNAWVNVGTGISGISYAGARMAMNNLNNPVVVYTDSTTGNLQVKKFDGSNWIDLLLPSAKAPFALAIDGNNMIYLASLISTGNFTSNITISKYNGSSWDVTPAVAATYYGNLDLTVDTVTNIPYLVYSDVNTQQATVLKSVSGAWTVAGNAGFSAAPRGIWDPTIRIDRASHPIVVFQEDNGFERLSAYKLGGSVWTALEPRFFSKGHAYHSSFALDHNNDPFVLFQDATYNNAWTVRSLRVPGGDWDTVGRRGSIPGAPYVKALAIAPDNSVFIAYTDTAHGYKATVLKLNNPCYTNTNTWTGAVSHAWENPANWACGYVPQPYTNVVLNAGAVVVLNASTSIYSLQVQTGASLTVQPGANLTVLNP